MPGNDTVLSLENISHTYPGGVQILDAASANIQRGEMVALIGSSGLGKSTLLHIAGLMETPDHGVVQVLGKIAESDQERTVIRRDHLGFVFQFHHLLPEFTALENASLIGRIGGLSAKKAQSRAQELLERVGLGHRLGHAPATLSGGECQRVAIARALMNAPDVLLLDEPTGNLDAETATEVFNLLETLVREEHLACLYVTHNPEQAVRAHRCLTIREKKLVTVDD